MRNSLGAAPQHRGRCTGIAGSTQGLGSATRILQMRTSLKSAGEAVSRLTAVHRHPELATIELEARTDSTATTATLVAPLPSLDWSFSIWPGKLGQQQFAQSYSLPKARWQRSPRGHPVSSRNPTYGPTHSIHRIQTHSKGGTHQHLGRSLPYEPQLCEGLCAHVACN